MRDNRTFGIQIIGWGTILSATLLATSYMFGIDARSQAAGPYPLLLAALMLLTAWGYLKLTRWGFYMMEAHAGLLVVFSAHMVARYNQLPFLTNIAWGLFALVYTFARRECFDSETGIRASQET